MAESTPGAVDPVVDPVSIIPAGQLPAAAAAVQSRRQNGPSDPRDVQLLQSIQNQLSALMGKAVAGQQPDLVVVNPHGRVVEISGSMVSEYLAKPGFRKASKDEETNYRKAILRQMPDYLIRREKKRLQEQAKLLDNLEAEDDLDNTSLDELQRAPVVDGQLTNAQPAAPNKPKPQVSQPEGDSIPDEQQPKPKPRRRSRRAKPAKKQS